IQATTLSIQGKAFPKISALGFSVQGACQPFETRHVDVAKIDISGPPNDTKGKGTPITPVRAVYSEPSPYWTISSYSRIVLSTAGSYVASDNGVPPNYSYLTSTQFSAE